MLYIILVILAAIATAILILRCRVKLHLSDKQMSLFVGLGRTGPEFDLREETSILKLFGHRIKRFEFERHEEEAPDEGKRKTKRRRRRARLAMSVNELMATGGRVLRALWRSQRSLLRRIDIEELNGELVGGFDSPDRTGIAFGCYQAAISAVPRQYSERFSFVPYWQGAYFKGNLNASIAIPLYKVVYELLALLLRLPLRKLVTLTIGKEKGRHDVE